MDKIDNKFMGLVGIFFLVFGLFAVNVFFGRNLKTIRAKNAVPSAEKTSIFASAREIAANGTDKATISVFVRDADGNGISDTPVTVTSTVGTIAPSQESTDKSGIVSFFLTCTSTGVAQITAQAKGVAVGNAVSVACK